MARRSPRIRPLLVLAVGIPWGLLVAFGIVWLSFVFTPRTSDGDAFDPSLWQGDRALLEPVEAQSFTGSQITMTDNLRPHDATVRIGPDDVGLVLDPLRLHCNGGRIRVIWTVGDLEPIEPSTGIHLSARLDGVTIGSVLRGSSRGNWNDLPRRS